MVLVWRLLYSWPEKGLPISVWRNELGANEHRDQLKITSRQQKSPNLAQAPLISTAQKEVVTITASEGFEELQSFTPAKNLVDIENIASSFITP